jgi:prepilin-type N-terminal cleavage/methylation domain-containing protein
MKMKQIKNIRKAGFTLVEIMIVVAIIGLLAAIAIPNFVRARATAQSNACINNLRQIDAATQQWALEMHQLASATATAPDIAPYLGRGTAGATVNLAGGQVPGAINCPASGTYSLGATIAAKPTCSLGAAGTAGAAPFHWID